MKERMLPEQKRSQSLWSLVWPVAALLLVGVLLCAVLGALVLSL